MTRAEKTGSMFPMERSSGFAEELPSKFPDLRIQVGDGQLQELRGVLKKTPLPSGLDMDLLLWSLKRRVIN